MDYRITRGLDKAKEDIFNTNGRKCRVDHTRKILEALEPYRKCKRLNSTHCKEINAKLGSNCIHCDIRKREYALGESTHEFVWFYDIMEWNNFNRQGSKKKERSEVMLRSDELSGESVYLTLELYLKQMINAVNQDTETLEEYQQFYKELAELCKKHRCAEIAVGYMER